jgi:hypothetical protein
MFIVLCPRLITDRSQTQVTPYRGGGGGPEASLHDLKTRHAIIVEKNQLNTTIQER